jgi:hypothetical protein
MKKKGDVSVTIRASTIAISISLPCRNRWRHRADIRAMVAKSIVRGRW